VNTATKPRTTTPRGGLNTATADEATQHGAPKSPPPDPAPARVPINQAIGKMVKCCECGHPSFVDNARGSRTETQVISSKFWVKTICKPPGVCGAKLRKVTDLVELLEQPEPVKVKKALGESVGKFVLCPLAECGCKSMAIWRDDVAHAVQCPVHGLRAYPTDTQLEVIA
jgi:hypothetical protein